MRFDPNSISRRNFIGQANCAALGGASVTASLLNLGLLGRVAAADMPEAGDYKALVCVFLSGGNDSFNMIAPGSGDGYQEYISSRGNVGLPPIGDASGLLALNGVVSETDERELGVHPSLPLIRDMYNDGKAAIVANVGTLVQPTDLSEINLGTARLPNGLFSHSDQAQQWQTSVPDDRKSATGWAGRMADLLRVENAPSNVSMNISAHGENIFQTGGVSVPFAIGATGAIELSAWRQNWFRHRRLAIENILDENYQNVLERTLVSTKKKAIVANGDYVDAISAAPSLATTFTESNPLSVELKNVARTIAARNQLGVKRQTFFVQMSGFDLHGRLDQQHPLLLGRIQVALSEFFASLDEMCVSDKVTTFTSSDFARTLSTNGSGTDHAWGGNHLVFGGAVKGGKVYGNYPELALESALDTGRGRLIPTTSVDEYVSDLALWMGVSKPNLPLVLPNLSRFHDPNSGPAMGYMK
jgi:uncharacterized protein (DUF1501 family)